MGDSEAHSPKQFLDRWDAHAGPLPQGPFATDGDLIAAMLLQEEALLDLAVQFPFSHERLTELRKIKVASGQEHEVYLPKNREFEARVLKVTRTHAPGQARWGLRRATPREYLARLDLLDANSNTHILVEGIAIEFGAPLLVTSMDFVDGTHLSGPKLDELLCAHGWEKVYDSDNLLSYRNPADGTLMRDAHPKNFILTPSGKLVPIDVIFVGFARFDLRMDAAGSEEEFITEEENPPLDEL